MNNPNQVYTIGGLCLDVVLHMFGGGLCWALDASSFWHNTGVLRSCSGMKDGGCRLKPKLTTHWNNAELVEGCCQVQEASLNPP